MDFLKALLGIQGPSGMSRGSGTVVPGYAGGMFDLSNGPGVRLPEPGPVPGSDAEDMAALEVTAQPRRKAKTLGRIADFLAVLGDEEPQYAPRLERQRQRDAMEGFSDDPMGAIRRMAKEDPGAAWKLYQDHLKAQREQMDSQRQLRDTDADIHEKVWGRVSSMLNATTRDNYGAMKGQIVKYLNARGAGDLAAHLPNEYDPDAINLLVRSGIPAKDQVDDASMEHYRRERLRDFDEDRGVRREGQTIQREGQQITRDGQALSRENRGNTPATTTVNKRGETVVYYPDGRVTTLRDSVDPRGKKGGGRRAPPGGATQFKENGRYRDPSGKIFTVKNGKRVYD